MLLELFLAVQEEVAGGPSLGSPEECQEVWQCLSPYAEGMEGDSKMLGRLQGVCRLHASPNHEPACAARHPLRSRLTSGNLS